MDKFFRAVFVALAVGFAWGIRGHFGHMIGPMFPGAMLGLGVAYVSGQKTMFRWMPILGAFGGLGIAIGGYTSYGILHGYAQSAAPAPWYNYAYGFAMLAIQGGCWGTFGCAAIAAVFDSKKPSLMKFLELIAFLFFFGWLFQVTVTHLVGFHINPPRSDALLGHLGAAITMMIWLAWNRYILALRGALLGFGGFGMGMIIGRLLANTFQNSSITLNNWNVMEITAGLIGGFVFTLGMIGKELPERPNDDGYPALSFMGIFYVLGIIPLLHRLTRIETTEALKAMIDKATGWQLTNPELIAKQGMYMVDMVIVAAWIAALCWLIIYLLSWTRLGWFPILALGGLISFLDLFNQLYFYNPAISGMDFKTFTFDMRTISMGIYALMLFYIFIREIAFPHTPILQTDDKMQKIPWFRWSVSYLAVCLCVFLLAHYVVNSEKTMKSANTRWPTWGWNQGIPFPENGEQNQRNR